MIKALFIFPPAWSIFSPSIGIPNILGFLKQHNYQVEALDINIKLFRYLYNNPKFYMNMITKIKENTKFNSLSDKLTMNSSYGYEYLLKTVNNFKLNNYGNLFNQKENVIYASLSNDILELITSPNNHEYIKNYFENLADTILLKQYNYIGFSLNCKSQRCNSIFFAKILREKGYKGIISFGGTDINLIKDTNDLKKLFKENIIDFAIIGLGEEPTRQILEYIEGKTDKKLIPNVIYKDLNEINITTSNIISKISYPAWDGYDFNDYILPEIISPIRASRGCYWGKCVFCDFYHMEKYQVRDVDEVINEIKNSVYKYKINNFYFVDAALSPEFIDVFAEKIIKEKIKIYYFTNLRLEDKYTFSFMKKLYKSGLRSCAWGLESGSQNILNKMQKGINIKSVYDILKNSYKAGIVNHICLINGFPGETNKDVDATYSFMKKINPFINSFVVNDFHLNKLSYMYNNFEKYGISELVIQELIKENPNHYQFSSTELKLFSQEEIDYRKKKLESVLKGKKTFYSCFEEMLLAAKYNCKDF